MFYCGDYLWLIHFWMLSYLINIKHKLLLHERNRFNKLYGLGGSNFLFNPFVQAYLEVCNSSYLISHRISFRQRWVRPRAAQYTPIKYRWREVFMPYNSNIHNWALVHVAFTQGYSCPHLPLLMAVFLND